MSFIRAKLTSGPRRINPLPRNPRRGGGPVGFNLSLPPLARPVLNRNDVGRPIRAIVQPAIRLNVAPHRRCWHFHFLVNKPPRGNTQGRGTRSPRVGSAVVLIFALWLAPGGPRSRVAATEGAAVSSHRFAAHTVGVERPYRLTPSAKSCRRHGAAIRRSKGLCAGRRSAVRRHRSASSGRHGHEARIDWL